uniref:Uncharacterized protein n=1 Tax=viral metagenome TaxID=1070528 RepID=A0A6M3JSS5_9ZZZZ
MKKIVINAQYGGFGLSHEAVMRYAELKGVKLYPFIDKMLRKVFEDVYHETPTIEDNRVSCISYALVPPEAYERLLEGDERNTNTADRFKNSNAFFFSVNNIERDDPYLIQTVEELGDRANGKCASLRIVKIPNDIKWVIEEYNGSEYIAEKHRTWYVDE